MQVGRGNIEAIVSLRTKEEAALATLERRGDIGGRRTAREYADFLDKQAVLWIKRGAEDVVGAIVESKFVREETLNLILADRAMKSLHPQVRAALNSLSSGVMIKESGEPEKFQAYREEQVPVIQTVHHSAGPVKTDVKILRGMESDAYARLADGVEAIRKFAVENGRAPTIMEAGNKLGLIELISDVAGGRFRGRLGGDKFENLLDYAIRAKTAADLFKRQDAPAKAAPKVVEALVDVVEEKSPFELAVAAIFDSNWKRLRQMSVMDAISDIREKEIHAIAGKSNSVWYSAYLDVCALIWIEAGESRVMLAIVENRFISPATAERILDSKNKYISGNRDIVKILHDNEDMPADIRAKAERALERFTEPYTQKKYIVPGK
ncbi:MAG TPA: hypothetical protein VND15_00225 [Candidatus Acidoferrales bacterium]|nr:hypothetical protein [Candidatus Acidoferrales bacterium]